MISRGVEDGVTGAIGGAKSLLNAEEQMMSTHDVHAAATAAGSSAPLIWVRVGLGLILVVAGIVILGDVTLASLFSLVFIGATAIAAGVFEIAHAFWVRKWRGFASQVLLGVLYVIFGIVLVSEPMAGSLLLTYVLGLLLVFSGILRLLLGYNHWQEAGWIMLLSGAFGVLAGLVILSGFPKTAFWVLGLLLGIDLISHGAAWLAYGRLPFSRAPIP